MPQKNGVIFNCLLLSWYFIVWQCSVKEVDNIIIFYGVKNSINFGDKQIFYEIGSESQLFVDKTVFLEKKS